MPNRLKRLAPKLLLLLAGCVLGLVIVEISLRVFFPRYEYAAESEFERNTTLIFGRRPHTLQMGRHPDNGGQHRIYHNELALRQHREFTEQDLESGTNLGFFGDSFTENLRLPAPYSFTELTDYLLNTRGSGFNVLNFGVDSYGTDQAYLYYLDFEYAQELDYVFYVFCANDLRNIYENDLISVDEKGELVRSEAPPSPLWVRSINRFHTTYLVIEFLQRLGLTSDEFVNRLDDDLYRREFLRNERQARFHDPRADSIDRELIRGGRSADLERCVTIFRKLLRSWQQEVEKRGGRFVVILLPRVAEHRARFVVPEEIEVIDLYESFLNITGEFRRENWFFENDKHWNEAANHLAATVFYRFIEDEKELPRISDRELKEAVYTYYSSFRGWMPEDQYLEPVDVAPREHQRIKKYYDEVPVTR